MLFWENRTDSNGINSFGKSDRYAEYQSFKNFIDTMFLPEDSSVFEDFVRAQTLFQERFFSTADDYSGNRSFTESKSESQFEKNNSTLSYRSHKIFKQERPKVRINRKGDMKA